uniref:Titin n=1 Tax=Seriola lalandi dorsalis TaxID=1841481 RepID=A0A3B4WPE8_SERLL
MVLTWEAPPEDGGSPITGYIIEKHDKEGVRWTRCNRQTVTDLTLKVTGLLESHLYEFRVAAENAVGVGEPTSPTVFYKALDPIFKPGPPHNPKVTDTTKTSVFLSWSKPVCDGGCEIQGYIVECCTTTMSAEPAEAPAEAQAEEAAATDAPAEEWIMCTPPTGVKKTKFEVVKLKENQAYRFRVCAINKVGVATVSKLNPGEEYLFRVTAINDKGKSDPKVLAGPVMTKDLVFEPDVRPAFSSYSVHVGKDMNIDIPIFGRPKPAVSWTKDGAPLKVTTRVNILNTPTHTTLSIKDAAGDDGGMYSINVSNSAGKKDTTVEIIVLDKPGPPSAIHVTKDTIVIQWTKPEYDGGSNITGYTVEKRDMPEGRWVRANFTNVIETKFTVTGLTENAQYDFRVIAKNAVGTISKPSFNSGPTTASDKVEAPKFSIDPAFTKAIIINAGETFKLDADVHGKPLPAIQWFKDEKPIENTLRLEIKNTEHHAMIVIKDSVRIDGGVYTLQLTNEAGSEIVLIITLNESISSDAGKYEVTASNAGGTTKILIIFVVLDRPGPPVGPVEIGEVGETTVCLKWAPSEYDGGSPVTNYVVLKRETSTPTWAEVSTSIARSAIKVTKLTKGEEYQFRIKAQNRYGVSDYIDSKSVMIKLPYSKSGLLNTF